jgi:hypothetical protein
MKKITTLGLLVIGLGFAGNAWAYTPVPGDVIKVAASDAVFLVDDSLQRYPLSAGAFEVRYNNNFKLVKTVTEQEWGSYTTHFIINRALSHPAGSLVVYWQDPTIYLIENGYKRGFATWNAFASRGYSTSDIDYIGAYEAYPTGPVIK